MKTVTCTCGDDILVVPNLRRMSAAVERHVRKKHSESPLSRIRVRHELTQKILEAAGKE